MFNISEETVVAILNYLGTRPYNEVVQLITNLSRVSRVIEEKQKEENADITPSN